MTTIGITGVNGFIGQRMARRALSEGWTVRGFDIDDSVNDLAERGVKVAVGDVGDRDFLRKFFDGVDVVFHTAAIVDESGDAGRFRRVNVEGTQNVVDAASTAGVERMVHLSSVMVYGFDYPQDVTEDHPLEQQKNIYCATKLESDEIAQQAHQEGGLEVVVIRPGDVYGAASRPWMLRPLEMMEAGLFNLPGGGQGLVNHVHVDNLLDAVLLSLEKGATGEVFNITDGQAPQAREFFRYHADFLGKKKVPTVPTVVLKSFLTLAGPAWKLMGSEPPATPEALQFLLRKHNVSSEKARTMLGFRPRLNLEDGMAQVHDELIAAGRIKRKP